MVKPPLMILPVPVARKISHRFTGLNQKIGRLFPGMERSLRETDLGLSSDEYVGIVLVNAFFFFILFFPLLLVLSMGISNLNLPVSSANQLTSLAVADIANDGSLQRQLWNSFLSAGGIFILLVCVLLIYPKILAGKKAEQIDQYLVFALKDLLSQLGAGVPLYNALLNVSRQGYGQISREFGKVAQEVNAGKPMEESLQKMAERSKSEFLRRTTWQLVNTLKAGASLKGALRSIIDDLSLEQKSKIKNYAHELNLWSLIYMLFAVAIPTIGATMLVILSSFAGIGVNQGLFIFFVFICFIIQASLIGFIKSRRPMVAL